jgi:hypothetical protein
MEIQPRHKEQRLNPIVIGDMQMCRTKVCWQPASRQPPVH